MPITPYGNAEPGDYPALFTGCFEARFPKAKRLIFGFAILNADRRTAHDGPDGGGLYAVAVCNLSEGINPKSKPFRIRKAMLQPEEFADVTLAIRPPPPEHFEARCGERLRVLDIRVARRDKDGRQVSVVTDICRPRDRVWQSIEGVYEGAAAGTRNGRPFWLQEDGRAIRWEDHFAPRVNREEASEWLFWNQTTNDQLGRWIRPDGTLLVLTDIEIAALQGADATRYQIAKRRAALRMLGQR